MSDQISTKISTDNLDPPGLAGQLFVVPIYENNDIGTDKERLADESARKFSVHASLGKQAQQPEGISIAVPKEAGSSFIKAHPDAVITKLYSPEGEIFIHHNSERELARVEFECIAKSASEARSTFIKGFTPYLDHSSYLANVPIHISQVSVRDTVHEIQSTFYFSPYHRVQINPHAASLKTELLPIYALYREAKNSSSPFYRFLCYYKILEGMYLVLRPKCFKAAKQAGKELTRKKELVPCTSYLTEQHPDLVGKPIKPIFDGRFQSEFRNKVAHYLLDSTIPVNVSDFDIFSGFASELGLIESCAREVIKTHEQYLSEISAK